VACRSARVLAEEFRSDRGQRRCRKMNAQETRLHIGTPTVTREKLDLKERLEGHAG
jgi:arginyl-tRNA--protein-N-Asp/Glu arginylyltransferase